MRAFPLLPLTGILIVASIATSSAASLSLSPVSVEVTAPGAAAVLTLRNQSEAPIDAQIRIFRWGQSDGVERLEPTDDVVASPPSTTLAPSAEYTVRLVRLSKQPVSRGESYRVIIDELPAPMAGRSRAVNFVMRYSIPAFFYPREAADGELTWSVEHRDGRLFLLATNSGDRHVRISALKLRTRSGNEISFGAGLLGYALGRSSMAWPVPSNAVSSSDFSSFVVTADSNHGQINAQSTASSGR